MDNRKPFATSGYGGAVAFDNSPIYSGIFEIVEVTGRNKIEFGAADVGTQGAEQTVPASSRFEQRSDCNIRLFLGTRAHSRIEIVSRFIKLALISFRKFKT
jgi:hypothetical protein